MSPPSSACADFVHSKPIRLIFVAVKSDIGDSSTTHFHQEQQPGKAVTAPESVMPDEVIALVSRSGTTLLIRNLPFLGRNHPTALGLKDVWS